MTWVGSVDARETRACAPIRRPEQRRVGLHHRTSLPSNEWLLSTACGVCHYCALHGAHPRAPVCLLRVDKNGLSSQNATTEANTLCPAVCRARCSHRRRHSAGRDCTSAKVWYDRPRTAVIDSRAWSTSGPALERNSPGAGESRCWSLVGPTWLAGAGEKSARRKCRRVSALQRSAERCGAMLPRRCSPAVRAAKCRRDLQWWL